jgi:hypothetical protein
MHEFDKYVRCGGTLEGSIGAAIFQSIVSLPKDPGEEQKK